jgi:hypothetical protein
MVRFGAPMDAEAGLAGGRATQAGGVVDISRANGAWSFAVVTDNVRSGATITASTDTGAATLPIAVTVCQTNPSGQCMPHNQPERHADFWSICSGTGNVPFDPADNRIFVAQMRTASPAAQPVSR